MRAHTRGLFLTPPKTATWWAAVILGALGIVLHYEIVTIAALMPWSFPMVALGLILLAAGCALQGL